MSHDIAFADRLAALQSDCERLQEELLRAHIALDLAEAAAWDWNIAANAMELSEGWLERFGYHRGALSRDAQALMSQVVHPLDMDTLERANVALMETGTTHYEAEFRICDAQGALHWVRRIGRVTLQDEGGRPLRLMGVDVDVTARKRRAAALRRLATHDATTGLPRREYFIRRLQSQVEKAGSTTVSIVYLDLDDFHEVNGNLGHRVADAMLEAFSRRLLRSAGSDAVVAHLASDEFGVGWIGADPKESGARAQELLAQLSGLYSARGAQQELRASAGRVHAKGNAAMNIDHLVRQAYQAMCRAKVEAPGTCAVHDPEADAQHRQRSLELVQMRVALQRGEFVLHYQPRVQMRSGELLGLEALLRWEHPEQGLLPPSRFLPLIEQDRFAIEVGAWVLRSALDQLRQWNAKGLRTRVSVNIDAIQLQDAEFSERLDRILAEFPEVDPRQLELELLETGALHDMSRASSIVAHAQSRGIRCALDDFGTGFSSLTFLKQLGAQIVKIDRSFVSQMLEDPEHLILIDSVVGLCESLGREPVAEGVETEEHGRVLMELGCVHAQGFGIARPMPSDQVSTWVRTWSVPASWHEVVQLPRSRFPELLAELSLCSLGRAVFRVLRDPARTHPGKVLHGGRFATWLCEQMLIPRERERFAPLEAQWEQWRADVARALTPDASNGPSADASRLEELEARHRALVEHLRRLRTA